MKIGKTIKYIRELLKIKQLEMAHRLGMEQSNLCNIESDKIGVGIKTLKKVSAATGIPMGLIIAEYDELMRGRQPDMEKIYRNIREIIMTAEEGRRSATESL